MKHTLPAPFQDGWLLFLVLWLFPVLAFVPHAAKGQQIEVSEAWAARFDGQGQTYDVARKLAVDAAGNSYVAGTSNTGIRVVKYNPTGEQLWVGTYNEGSYDYPTAIALDEQGGVYVAGATDDRFLTIRFDAANGARSWATVYQNDNPDQAVATAIATDGKGGVFVTGFRAGLPLGEGGFRTADYLTIRYAAADGAEQWVSHYAGAGDDYAKAIAVDGQGDVYVTGQGNDESGTLQDILTVSYHGADGAQRWAARYDNDLSLDAGQVIAVDNNGGVYVAGNSGGENDYDYVTLRYEAATGSQTWLSRFDGPEHAADFVQGLALDGQGQVFVTGVSYGATLGEDNEVQADYSTVGYRTADGAQLWASRYNGTGHGRDLPAGIAADRSGGVYVTGTSAGNSGDTDYATIRYDAGSGAETWVSRYDGAGNTTDYAGDIAASEAGVYVTGQSDSASTSSDFVTIQYAPGTGAEVWRSRYQGTGSTNDAAVSIVIDQEGNSYVTGPSVIYGGGTRIQTIKYAPNGEQLWAVSYQGKLQTEPAAIATDNAGGVYVAGESDGQYLTMRLNASDGSTAWVQHYQAKSGAYAKARAIAVDNQGGVYVTGLSYSDSVSDESYFQPSDYATLRYNATDGQQVWLSRYEGGGGLDAATAIVVDNKGGVYVTGRSESRFAPEYEESPSDFATVRYNASDGSQVWVSRYDGGSYDVAGAMALDSLGGLFVTGRSYTDSTTFDYGTLRYDASSGAQVWVSRYDGEAHYIDTPRAIAVDNQGGVYVTGQSYGPLTGDFDRSSSYATLRLEASDGTRSWVSLYGAGGNDEANAIAADAQGGVYVTGTSRGEEGRYIYATLRLSAADGAQVWSMRKPGLDDVAIDLALDPQGDVLVTGWSTSLLTGSDFLTVKYSQRGSCQPLVPQTIAGPGAVRAGAENVVYRLPGTGASTFSWSVTGDATVSATGTQTDQLTVSWPAAAGLYQVGVEYGNTCARRDTSLTVAVADPDAGFVTGAGWLSSPATPPLPDMQIAARAYFVIAAWYAKDAHSVQGFTRVRVPAAGLDFRSSANSPLRLVVHDNVANYTGVGSVNGQEGYGFLVAAVDGDLGPGREPDKLRLKIWELATGRTVYDNQADVWEGVPATEAISAGQIVIHRPMGKPLDLVAALAAREAQQLVPQSEPLACYPSVVAAQATLTFSLLPDEAYTLRLYDLKGQLVREIAAGTATTEAQQAQELQTTAIANGVYIARLTTSTKTESTKLVVQH